MVIHRIEWPSSRDEEENFLLWANGDQLDEDELEQDEHDRLVEEGQQDLFKESPNAD